MRKRSIRMISFMVEVMMVGFIMMDSKNGESDEGGFYAAFSLKEIKK